MSEPSEIKDLSTEDLGHIEFQSHMPYMGLQLGDLTVQQEKLVLMMARGMNLAAAGRAAGYASYSTAQQASKLEKVQKALRFFREQLREEVFFDRTQAHQMYLEAYNVAANSTEMKNTVDSLVKLHGLGSPEQTTQVNVQINTSAKQLERLSDEQLLEIVGRDASYLEPEAS